MLTLFKNGTVVDGSGNKPFVSDVLVEDGKIAKIAKDIQGEFDKTVDCNGLIVAPGFIDAHSHNDFFYDYANSKAFYSPFLEQGITTQVTGNCGFSPFGIDKDSKYKSLVGGGLFHTENPGSFADFKNRAKGNLYVNMIPLIGHGTTRISISGYEPKPLSEQQIKEEMKLVDEAMEGGAFGGSFGFMYQPGMFSQKEELYAFASEVAKYDGIVTVHPRACSKVALGYPLLTKKPHIELGLDEVIDIMEKSKVRMEYSHLIFVGKTSWPSCEPMLKQFHDYNAKGYKIAYDNYSFTYGASVITIATPAWYLALTPEEKKKPFNMLKLRLMTWITKKALGLDFCDFNIAYISDDHKEYEGKTVQQCADEEGISGFDMYIKLVDLSNGQGRLYIEKYYNEDIIKRLMEDDLSVFMTDAWVEEAGTQNGAAYQCFPYFLVRAKNYGIPVENVVRKMSGAIADRFEVANRGYLKEGYAADITVFDNAKVAIDAKKPNARPQGIAYVYVNGKEAVANGQCVDTKAGEVILRK